MKNVKHKNSVSVVKKDNISKLIELPPEGADAGYKHWSEAYLEYDYPEPNYTVFGLRRLVQPADLEFWPCGDGLEAAVNAASDNFLVVGQDLKAVVLLTERAMAEKDPVTLTAGLLALAAHAANLECVLERQYYALRLMLHILLDMDIWPDPEDAERAPSHPKKLKVATFSRSMSAIRHMGEQLERLEGQFRDKFDRDRDEDRTSDSLIKFHSLRWTLPRKLKSHLSTILDSPEVRALVPEAGRLTGKAVPLFTGYLKGSAKR